MSRVLEGVCETLSPVLGFCWSAESLQHQADHGNLNHGLAVLDEFLVIFAEPTGMAKPCERALDHPSPWQQLKTDLVLQLANDLQYPAAAPMQPLDQLPGVCAIGPHQRDRRNQGGRLDEQ